MRMTQVSCHGNSCSTEERNLKTRTNHMCLGIDVSKISTLESSEESFSSSYVDESTLKFRLRRLFKRANYMFRQMKSLKEKYIVARGLDQAPFQNLTDFISLHPCLGPLEFKGRKHLSTKREKQLVLRLEHDYDTLTTMVGVLKLMQNDEEEYERKKSMSNRIVSARLGTERVICELFLTIRKLHTELSAANISVDSRVPESGLYTPVVRSWCSVKSGSCRHERNGVILTQLLQFAYVLRKNYRRIR
ncbi:uncharacterized protein LOC110452057 isoform X2 [Mizuhopecten yessoensis]|nr:uncharacterized protein LOC110452057 isoform X2 [Mizuhopecten yessoensis]